MRVGIIGCGNIAKHHAHAILRQKNAKIVGVSDKFFSLAKKFANELHVENVYRDAKKMLEDKKPDVVHVLTAPEDHYDLSIIAMEMGSHVLVEKPMALNIDDAKKMYDVAMKNNVKLCVDHNYIFENVVQRAIKLLQNGVIGDPISIEVCYAFDAKRNQILLEDGAENFHWYYKMKGGFLQDLIPHVGSLIMEFVPKIEELKVIELNRGVLPNNWSDEIRLLLKSRDILCYGNISLSEKPDELTFTIKGTKGKIYVNLFNNILILDKETALPRMIKRGLSGIFYGSQYFKGAIKNFYLFATKRIDKSGGLEPLISKFYTSIIDNSDPPISMIKSIGVVEMIESIWPEKQGASKSSTCISPTAKKNRHYPSTLVTGATGFLGIHLVKKLISKGIKVRALVRPNSIHSGRIHGLNVDIIEGDLNDQKAVEFATKGIKKIYHAGAALNNDWDDNYETNIKGTKSLIKTAIENNVERFVHLSTLVVYDTIGLRNGSIISETSPYQPYPKKMGPYAYSKLKAELLVLDAHKNFDLPVTILRPGIVIGPLGKIFFPHLGFRYQNSIFVIIGKGDNILPLTYVENTVDAIYKASIEKNAVGQIFNIVDDGEITPQIYLDRFLAMSKHSAKIFHVPYLLPYIAAAAYEIGAGFGIAKEGVTSRKQLKWKQVRVKYDNSKAKKVLNWQPRIPLDDGLKKTFEWYTQKYLN